MKFQNLLSLIANDHGTCACVDVRYGAITYVFKKAKRDKIS